MTHAHGLRTIYRAGLRVGRGELIRDVALTLTGVLWERCPSCQRDRVPSALELGCYMATGWPTACKRCGGAVEWCAVEDEQR